MQHSLKQLFVMMVLTLTAFTVQAAKPTSGNYYANATQFNLDPKLPEPFARTQAAQVIVSFEHQDVSLIFIMSDSEGIDVTFPMVSDKTDRCNVREIIAAPPAGSTPYYKDFEIKVIDYSENTCDSVKAPSATVATLKSYEVRHQTTTHSTILAEGLKPSPKDEN